MSINEHINIIERLEKNLEHLHVKYTKMETTAHNFETELNETHAQLE